MCFAASSCPPTLVSFLGWFSPKTHIFVSLSTAGDESGVCGFGEFDKHESKMGLTRAEHVAVCMEPLTLLRPRYRQRQAAHERATKNS